ncbi:CYFA0S01e09076g1_1 [Cyberlindnera fabianii]|uniref:CYFA0S01e09076g1_1 n=1 Tax=Cyberlindnera fabianii TaxID=36022 RepID=A0A061ARB8_CYBFA|nr:CYFA0S01e09076g1_1 [Cyberlindnera fabianii]
MSILYTDQAQGYNMNNLDMFINTTPVQGNPTLDTSITETPSPKRRRGRPSKCPEDSSQSPAASLSAAVLKQGTPKASSPLMRVSPRSGRKRSYNSSPLQHKMVNSPRGGTLMRLDVGKTKPTSPSAIAGPIASKPHKARKTSTKKAATANNFYNLFPSRVSLSTQQNIDAITRDTVPDSKLGSVNPTLLLSSPISASKINEINKSRTPIDTNKSQDSSSGKMEPPSSTTVGLVSSPMTPTSANSSCFSSIVRSSPLYHGYYAHQSSPGTSVLASSPMRFHMKPLSEVKIDFSETKSNKNSQNVSKNPHNSSEPTGSQSSTSPRTIDDLTDGQYKLSFGIDEFGQAIVTRVKIPKPAVITTSTNSSPSPKTRKLPPSKLTRHQSLATVPQVHAQLDRSVSLSSLPTLKSTECDFFIEPSKITRETSMFNGMGDDLGFEVMTPLQQTEINIEEDMGTTSDEVDLVVDDCDARNALMKMIRRSL